MTARRRKPIRRTLVARMSVVFLWMAGALPLSWARAMARALGVLAWYVVPRIQRIGLKNLDTAYGDSLTPKEKKRLLKRVVRSVATVGAEFPRIPSSLKEGSPLHVEMRGAHALDGMEGVLLIGAHLGNWELLAPTLVHLGKRLAGVVRPLDNPGLNAVVDAHRRAAGFHTIPKANAGNEMIRLLREGWAVGVLIDQNPRQNGVPSTFFGKPCWSTIAPVMIATRARVPVVPACVVRREDGSYVHEFGEPIEMVRTGGLHEDILVNTQRCQDAIEAMVRKYPDQWLWLHRRWRERPRLEKEWNERVAKARAKKAAPGEDREGKD